MDITGTNGNNNLIGSLQADTIRGLGGNDFIQGLDGDDRYASNHRFSGQEWKTHTYNHHCGEQFCSICDA
ncbi:MAG: hypothetical protein JGK37_03000, partial [Microcoleus sp. PH2017_06_SFM_O_A]|nr:hypothetical protein [Microcoleus sp. PH2017_06_SFM_O_A]